MKAGPEAMMSIHYAVLRDEVDVVANFCEQDRNWFYVRGNGKTPFEFAVEYGNIRCIKYFFREYLVESLAIFKDGGQFVGVSDKVPPFMFYLDEKLDFFNTAVDLISLNYYEKIDQQHPAWMHNHTKNVLLSALTSTFIELTPNQRAEVNWNALNELVISAMLAQEPNDKIKNIIMEFERKVPSTATDAVIYIG